MGTLNAFQMLRRGEMRTAGFFQEICGAEKVDSIMRDAPRVLLGDESVLFAGYLEACPTVIDFTEFCYCELGCGEALQGCSSIQTDGSWIWRRDFSHYVSKHGISPGEDFLRSVRIRNYMAVEWSELDEGITQEVIKIVWPDATD
jgi:hypothetical protein